MRAINAYKPYVSLLISIDISVLNIIFNIVNINKTEYFVHE